MSKRIGVNWGAVEREAGYTTTQVLRRIVNNLNSGGDGTTLQTLKILQGGSSGASPFKIPLRLIGTPPPQLILGSNFAKIWNIGVSDDNTMTFEAQADGTFVFKQKSQYFTSDVLRFEDQDAAEKIEVNSDFQVSIGAPAEKGSALNVKALTLSNGTGAGQDPSDLTALAGGLFVWYRAEDITGMNDEDEFVNNDPVWSNHATTVPGNPAYKNAADTVSTGCDGPNYYAGTNALGLNGYPTVVRSPNADAVTGYRDIGFSIGINDPYTIIAVYRAAPNSSLVLGNSVTFAEAFTFPSNAPNAKALVNHIGSPTNITSEFDNTVGLYGTDDWHIAVWTSNGVYIAYRHDGADLGSATAAVSSMAGEFFNGRLNGQYSSNKGAGIAELIQYDTELSTENIEALEAYLVDKYFSGSSDVLQWDAGDGVDGIIKKTTGNMGVGTPSPAAKLDVLATTEQARLSYDASNYASFTVDASGNLAVALTGTTPEATFADNVNVSGEVLITGANGLYFTNKTTGQRIKTTANDLTITADIDSSVGKVDIEDRVLITNKSTTEPILQLQATTGSGESIEILKNGGDDLFKVDHDGHIYGPEGTVAMRIVSQTDNVSAFDKKGAFDFIQDINADADDYFAKFKTFNGTTILRLTTDGRLWKDDDSADEFMSESGSHAFIGSMTVSSSAQFQWLDNATAFFGSQFDAGITYDGQDLIVSPQIAGTGVLRTLARTFIYPGGSVLAYSPTSTADDLTIVGQSSSGITIASTSDTARCSLYFGDGSSNSAGSLRFNHADDVLEFYQGVTLRWRVGGTTEGFQVRNSFLRLDLLPTPDSPPVNSAALWYTTGKELYLKKEDGTTVNLETAGGAADSFLAWAGL